MKIQIRDFGKVPSKSTSWSKIALFSQSVKKIAIKCWFLVIFPWFFSFKRATGSRERKEGMQWNLFIFRASKMFNLLSVSLDSWSFGGATQKVTLHSFNKNVAWLETGCSYPQRTNIWKVSNDHSTLNFLRNTLLHTNLQCLSTSR